MNKDNTRVRRLLNKARSESMQPGDRTPYSGAGFTTATDSTPTLETRVDEDGNTFPPSLWGVDNWNEADWS